MNSASRTGIQDADIVSCSRVLLRASRLASIRWRDSTLRSAISLTLAGERMTGEGARRGRSIVKPPATKGTALTRLLALLLSGGTGERLPKKLINLDCVMGLVVAIVVLVLVVVDLMSAKSSGFSFKLSIDPIIFLNYALNAYPIPGRKLTPLQTDFSRVAPPRPPSSFI